MRLYRGLSRPYRPEQKPEPLQGTNFTDCPYAAISYANTPRGVLLVLDVPEDGSVFIHEALWSLRDDPTAPRRFMLVRDFDEYLRAELPAKDLRKRLRRPGYTKMSDRSRSAILQMIIERMLDEQDRESELSERIGADQ